MRFDHEDHDHRPCTCGLQTLHHFSTPLQLDTEKSGTKHLQFGKLEAWIDVPSFISLLNLDNSLSPILGSFYRMLRTFIFLVRTISDVVPSPAHPQILTVSQIRVVTTIQMGTL